MPATDSRVSALPAAPAVAAGDLLYLVDVSDPADGPAGSSRRTTVGAVLAGAAVAAGATLHVDAVNGSDATGVRGDLSHPYLTPTAAQTAAQAGDLIHVRPGAYSVSASLGKNGVNWYFDAGATVTFAEADSTVSAVWTAPGFGCTYTVRGYGTFNRTLTAHVSGPFAAVVSQTNTTGVIDVECLDMSVTDPAGVDPVASGPRVVHQSAGKLRVVCRDMTCTGAVGTGGSDTTGACCWWTNGEMMVRARRGTSTGWGLYSQVDATPTGDCFVDVRDWQTSLASLYTAGANSSAAIWGKSDTVRNTAWGTAVFANGAEKLYVVAEKVFGGLSNAAGGLLYVTAQKVSPFLATAPLLRTTGTGQSWVDVLDWDTAGLTANVWSFGAGTADVFGGRVRPDAAALGVLHSGGTVRLHGCRIDTSANSATNPITVSGSGLELAAVELVAATGRDAVTAGTAQTVTLSGPASWNTTVSVNIAFASRNFAPPTWAGGTTWVLPASPTGVQQTAMTVKFDNGNKCLGFRAEYSPGDTNGLSLFDFYNTKTGALAGSFGWQDGATAIAFTTAITSTGTIRSEGGLIVGSFATSTFSGPIKSFASVPLVLQAQSGFSTQVKSGTGGGVVVEVSSAGGLGFFAATPAAKPTVSGSRGGNAALASLVTALATLGLLTDSTTA